MAPSLTGSDWDVNDKHHPDLDQPKFTRGLNLFDSTMVVVGAMIGSGIFIVPAERTRHLGSAGWLLIAWAVAAALTIRWSPLLR